MHLLDIGELSPEGIEELYALADTLNDGGERESLKGKTFALFFPESSLRTRMTFEKGIKSLGGECILFPPETLDKRERLSDVIGYVANWADGIVVRHADYAKVEELSRHSPIPIVNAMTSYNHPCEILTDFYSISRLKADYKELVYTFVGPAGNILRSWMALAKIMDLRFVHVCAPGNEQDTDASPRNYAFRTDLKSALADSDIVLTDSLKDEFRTEGYIRDYQLTLDRMKLTRSGSLLNPCPPFFRGEEVGEDVIESDYFVGHAFKKNLFYVHQAIVLYSLRN